MNTHDLIFTTVPCFDHCKILGNMEDDPLSLMLLTVMKNIRGLGYMLQVIISGTSLPLTISICLFAGLCFSICQYV